MVYLYTEKDYSQILNTFNAKYEPNEKLVYEDSHWHYCLPNGREKLADLIEELQLILKIN